MPAPYRQSWRRQVARHLASNKQGKASFCEQKEAKKLFYAGSWAMSATTPAAQRNKNFCAAFFKKRPLP
jgi:hypothetical protein